MNETIPPPREPRPGRQGEPWRLPAEPDLPADRHLLLKEALMDNLANAQRTSRRRRLAIRVATPVVVAAAAAGFMLTQTPSATGHPGGSATAAGHAPATAPVTAAPTHIRDVAYSLDRTAHGEVKITIRGTGAGKPDVAALEKNLAAMGVDGQVFQGDTCVYHPDHYADGSPVPKGSYYAVMTLADRNAKGDFVVTVDPHRIPAGMHLRIVFPVDSLNTAKLALSFGTPGKGAACLHLPGDRG